MRALSIRQPFAELILRGIKTVEYRSRPTTIVGERFFIYASKKSGVAPLASGGTAKAWSNDLAMPSEKLPTWMVELARQIKLVDDGTLLPTGVIVGTAIIDRVTRGDDDGGNDGFFHWHLAGVERIERHRKPTGHPQPVWFKPF